MKVNVPYSGTYVFVETRRYSSVSHQVVPARKALGYADDPARVGGRFYVAIGRGVPPR